MTGIAIVVIKILSVSFLCCMFYQVSIKQSARLWRSIAILRAAVPFEGAGLRCRDAMPCYAKHTTHVIYIYIIHTHVYMYIHERSGATQCLWPKHIHILWQHDRSGETCCRDKADVHPSESFAGAPAACLCISLSLSIYIYVYIRVCMYVYKYKCIYIYIYIYHTLHFPPHQATG